MSGSSAGGDDIVGLTSVGHSHHVVVTGLKLQTGQLYHVTVTGKQLFKLIKSNLYVLVSGDSL